MLCFLGRETDVFFSFLFLISFKIWSWRVCATGMFWAVSEADGPRNLHSERNFLISFPFCTLWKLPLATFIVELLKGITV